MDKNDINMEDILSTMAAKSIKVPAQLRKDTLDYIKVQAETEQRTTYKSGILIFCLLIRMIDISAVFIGGIVLVGFFSPLSISLFLSINSMLAVIIMGIVVTNQDMIVILFKEEI